MSMDGSTEVALWRELGALEGQIDAQEAEVAGLRSRIMWLAIGLAWALLATALGNHSSHPAATVTEPEQTRCIAV